MSEPYVQLAPDGNGKKVDAAIVLDSSNNQYYRQIAAIGDPTAIGSIAAVSGGALSVSDSNNASYSYAVPLGASGAAPGRAVGVNATAAGAITVMLAGSGTITASVGLGWQIFPFVATGMVLSGGAAGSVYNLS